MDNLDFKFKLDLDLDLKVSTALKFPVKSETQFIYQ